MEPGCDSFRRLAKRRPRDINLNVGIGLSPGEQVFFEVIGDNTLSSFREDVAQGMARRYQRNVEERRVEVLTLSDLLGEYASDTAVDFLSVDTEGRDLAVLESNDWGRFRPTLVLVELDRNRNEIVQYLESHGYQHLFNNYHNGLFMNNEADLPEITEKHSLPGADLTMEDDF